MTNRTDEEQEIEELQEEVKRLKEENKKLKQHYIEAEKLGFVQLAHKYGLPDYTPMHYQQEMIRKAVEHIFTYDTLKGLGQ